MATHVLNIAKGRAVELFRRVDLNDPANGVIVVVPMTTVGTEAQGQDLDDLAAVEADANFAERTTGGWVRKVLTDADITVAAPDDGNNRRAAAVPQITFTTPAAANNVAGFLICYDSDSTGGADSAIEVLSCHDAAVTTDGNDVIIQAGDVIRAS